MSTATTCPVTIPNTAPAPPVPKSLQDTGLGADQIEQLLIKTMYGGEASGLTLAERRLLAEVAEALQQDGRLRLHRADQRGTFRRFAGQSRGGIIKNVSEQPQYLGAVRIQDICAVRKAAHGPLSALV